MLDEPTANLAPAIASRVLTEVVSGLAESGTAIVLVEQRVALALSLAHHVDVLVDGTPRFTGTAEEFRALPDAGAIFFTRTSDQANPEVAPRPTP
jgi:branched-chain amino acid transport system ATP-binding protein